MTEKEIKKAEKFQKLMTLEAKRHAYMTKKEEYKRSFSVKFDDDIEPSEKKNEKIKVRMCK